jgi:hypothetical protein
VGRRHGAAAATALATSPAFATTTAYELGGSAHHASVGLIWLNRSVTVQGSVTDVGGAGTQVEFDAFAGITLVDVQTRTAVNEVRSFNFTLDGSAYQGGITKVNIYLYDLHNLSLIGSVPTTRP